MDNKQEQEKSTSEQLSVVLRQLSSDQIRFVLARQEYATDKEAAEAVGIKPNTVYQWKCRYSVPIDEAVRLITYDGLTVATELRRRNLAKAVAVKVAGLDSENERMRQGVATEIIEWEMGRATQKIAPTDPTGQKEYGGLFSDNERLKRIEALLKLVEERG